MLSLLVRRWLIAVPLLALTLIAAIHLERNATPRWEASGILIVAAPEIDPTRSGLRDVDVSALVDEADTEEARQAAVAAGGAAHYAVVAEGPRRIRVVVSDTFTVATTTGQHVLRRLARAVEREQIDSDRDPDDRVVPRMFLHVPPDPGDTDVDAVGATTRVVGTLVLDDPLEEHLSPLGGAQSARLLLADLTSDAGRERIATLVGDDVVFGVYTPDRDLRSLMQINLVGPDPHTLYAAFDGIVDEMRSAQQAREITADVPLARRRILEVLAAPSQAEDTTPPVHLPSALAVLLGLAVTTAAAALVDRRTRRRTIPEATSQPAQLEHAH